MRQTTLTNRGDAAARLTIVTDDQGTAVLDAEGRALHSYGSDRHDEQVARLQEEGWRVAEDGARRPDPVADTPPPRADGPGDGFRELDLGNTG